MRNAVNLRMARLMDGSGLPIRMAMLRMWQELSGLVPAEAVLSGMLPAWNELEERVRGSSPRREDIVCMGRMLRVLWLAEMVFADRTLAWGWLTHPKARLHGATPLQMLGDARKAVAMEHWLVDIGEGNGP